MDRVSRIWTGLSLVLIVTGCAGDDDCERLRVCDIRERSCQELVARTMACIRGGSAVVTPVELISEEQYLARIEPELARERTESQAAWARGLSLFGLSALEVDRDVLAMEVVQNVAAAYLPEERRIVVIDRGAPMESDEAVATLAHETIHAMQFAERDLDALLSGPDATYDGQLALRGLVEGEAVLYGNLAAIELLGYSSGGLDWRSYYEQWQSETLLDAEADAQPLDMAWQRFPYAFGGMFATEVWLARGSDGLRALFVEPPRATRELLFGPASVDLGAERDTLEAAAAPQLPENFERAGSAHLGAWIARIFSAHMGVPVASRLLPASALAADVFSVYRDTMSERVLATWRVRLLPAHSTSAWPLGHPPIDGWSAADPREAYQVAQSAASELDVRSLAWGPQPDDMPVAMMPAMAQPSRARFAWQCAASNVSSLPPFLAGQGGAR